MKYSGNTTVQLIYLYGHLQTRTLFKPGQIPQENNALSMRAHLLRDCEQEGGDGVLCSVRALKKGSGKTMTLNGNGNGNGNDITTTATATVTKR